MGPDSLNSQADHRRDAASDKSTTEEDHPALGGMVEPEDYADDWERRRMGW